MFVMRQWTTKVVIFSRIFSFSRSYYIFSVDSIRKLGCVDMIGYDELLKNFIYENIFKYWSFINVYNVNSMMWGTARAINSDILNLYEDI